MAERVGYPVVVRPSYVLGGRAMEIVYDRASLQRYMRDVLRVAGHEISSGPILLDRYLNEAIEADVDCIADGTDVYVAGVMEHIEEAGIHSGDSACALPPYTLSPAIVTELKAQTEAMARELGIVGLMNVQYAIKDQEIFVLEVNPRASRTVPFVAKATGVPVAKIGARVMAGSKLSGFNLDDRAVVPHVAVKEAVFPFNRFAEVDTILGPEMRSTGEVMGLDTSFERAFAKSQLGAGVRLPMSGTVFLSVRESDKPQLPPLGRLLAPWALKSWQHGARHASCVSPALMSVWSTRCSKDARTAWTPSARAKCRWSSTPHRVHSRLPTVLTSAVPPLCWVFRTTPPWRARALQSTLLRQCAKDRLMLRHFSHTLVVRSEHWG